METYFAAKRRLFEMLPADAPAVINLDDPRGASLRRRWRHGRSRMRISKAADVTPGPLSYSLDRSGVRRPHAAGHGARALAAGRPPERLQHPRRRRRDAPRWAFRSTRSSRVSRRSPACRAVSSSPRAPTTTSRVVVDYAHTDDALRNLLETARSMAPHRVITVFGCRRRSRSHEAAADGHGRGAAERRRRDHLGQPAHREDPLRIIEEVKRGAEPETRRSNARSCCRSPIARTAIASAPSQRGATRGDVVLIAGKGHEKYQEIGGRTQPFDDVAVAREALAARRREVTARGRRWNLDRSAGSARVVGGTLRRR